MDLVLDEVSKIKVFKHTKGTGLGLRAWGECHISLFKTALSATSLIATIRHSQPWVDYGYDDNWYPAEIFKTLADSDDDTEEFKIEKITDYKRVHNQVSY
jgi:hypothetical protein